MKTIGLIDEKIIKYNLINLKNLVFEVTEKCNLNCKYCGLSEQLYKKKDVRKKRNLQFKKAQSYRVDQFGNNSYNKVMHNVRLLQQNIPNISMDNASISSRYYIG